MHNNHMIGEQSLNTGRLCRRDKVLQEGKSKSKVTKRRTQNKPRMNISINLLEIHLVEESELELLYLLQAMIVSEAKYRGRYRWRNNCPGWRGLCASPINRVTKLHQSSSEIKHNSSWRFGNV